MTVKKKNKFNGSPYVPKGWDLKLLGELGTFSKGNGITKEQLSTTGLPCIRYGEIYTSHDYFIKEFHSFIPKEVAKESKRINKNDILLAGSGETLEDIGKAVAYIGNEEAYAGGDVIIFSPNGNTDSIFLSYFLNTNYANRQKRRLGQGHSVVHIYPYMLEELKIFLPPLSEQNKIRDILFSWNKAIELTEQLIIKKEKEKSSVIHDLITGRKRFKEFRGEKWKKISIEDIATVIRGSSPRPKGDPLYYGGNIPRLMVEDVTRDGKYVFPCVDFLTGEGAKLSRPVKKGTLVIVCSGDIGIPSILGIDACIHDGFIGFRDLRGVDVEFLFYLFSRMKDEFNKSATHGGVFTNLTTSGIKELELKLPSLNEQRKISFVIAGMDKEIQGIKSRLMGIKKLKSGLMQDLFTGRKRVKV